MHFHVRSQRLWLWILIPINLRDSFGLNRPRVGNARERDCSISRNGLYFINKQLSCSALGPVELFSQRDSFLHKQSPGEIFRSLSWRSYASRRSRPIHETLWIVVSLGVKNKIVANIFSLIFIIVFLLKAFFLSLNGPMKSLHKLLSSFQTFQPGNYHRHRNVAVNYYNPVVNPRTIYTCLSPKNTLKC